MLALTVASAAYAAQNFVCNFAFDGSAVSLDKFNVLSPVEEGCVGEWAAVGAGNVVQAQGQAGAVCRAVFDVASKPKIFDGTELDASTSADDEEYSGKVDPATNMCHFATESGMEVYTASFKVLKDECNFSWINVAGARAADVVTLGSKKLLCAAQYPVSDWQTGWVSEEKTSLKPLPRRELAASPEASPSPAAFKRKHKKVQLKLVIDSTVEAMEAKRSELTARFAALAGVDASEVELLIVSSSVTITAIITTDDSSATTLESTFADTSTAQFALSGIDGVSVLSVNVTVDELDSDSVPTWAIILIIVGSLVLVVLLIMLGFMMGKPKSAEAPTSKLAVHNEMHKSNEAL